MYVQITSKCNMTCGHCCFSCTGKGSFMTQEVFDKALEIAVERGEMVTLGGGEPTLHPKCLEWAQQAALALVDVSLDADCPAVMVITNGKKKKTAETLAKLSKLGIIQAELSQDRFHDPIDPQTVKTFERYAAIRDVTHGGRSDLVGVGRAAENDYIPTREGCACETLFIAPNGDFYGCGCKYKKLGNILADEIPESYWENHDQCHRELNERELVEA